MVVPKGSGSHTVTQTYTRDTISSIIYNIGFVHMSEYYYGIDIYVRRYELICNYFWRGQPEKEIETYRDIVVERKKKSE